MVLIFTEKLWKEGALRLPVVLVRKDLVICIECVNVTKEGKT